MESSTSLMRLIVNLVNTTGNQTLVNVYQGCASVYVNSLSYTLFGVSLTIWAFLKIKGDWSRNDLFKGMMWISIFIIIQVSLSSYENYMGVLSIFKIPYQWFSVAVSAFGGGTDLETMIGTQWKLVWDSSARIFNLGGITEPSMWILAGIYFIVGLAFMIALVVMTILSQFMANIILSLGALVFPLVCWSQTKSIFVSWLKMYIGLSLWSPFALLLNSIPSSVTKHITQGQILIANNDDLAEIAIVGLVLMIFSIYLLTKIPGWVSAIIGSAESSGGGSGLAGLTNAGLFTGGRMLTGLGQYAKNRAEGQSKGLSSIGAIGGAILGEHGNAIAQSAAKKVASAGQFIAKHTPFVGK